MTVVHCLLSFQSGNRESILLSGVPRAGDHVLLADTDQVQQALVVEQVLWLERGSEGEQSVILVVVPVAERR